MKISKLLMALVLGTALISCNCHQEGADKVPQSPRDAFDRGYPGATDIKWSADDHGEEFEVEFKYHYAQYEVTYDRKGNPVEIEYEIDTRFLPEGVLEAVEAKHPGKKIVAEYVEHRRHGFFEVEVMNQHAHGDKEGDDHGHNEVEIYYTLDGKEFDAEKMVECLDKCAAGTCEKDKESCHKKASCEKDDKKCCDKSGSEECCSKDGEGEHGDEHAEGEEHNNEEHVEEEHEEDHEDDGHH